MAFVYRYTDLTDGIIKYVGIVYGRDRTVQQRHAEHIIKDVWCNNSFKLEYIHVKNKGEAESIEDHLIALYKTYKWYNTAKKTWGINSFLPNEYNWQEIKLSQEDNVLYLYEYDSYCNVIRKKRVKQINSTEGIYLDKRIQDKKFLIKDLYKYRKSFNLQEVINWAETSKLDKINQLETEKDNYIKKINKSIKRLENINYMEQKIW